MLDKQKSISDCLKNVIEYNAVKVGHIHGERFYQDVYGKALLEKVEPYYVSKLLLGISERHSRNKIQKNTGETTILSKIMY